MTCQCFARCEADCICDHDWTPPAVVALRAENGELSTRYAFMCDAIKCAHETLNDGFMDTAMAILDAALAAKGD